MKQTREVLITTTPTLEGWRIDEYLGTVEVHLVAGTDFVTDIVASFSDFFGGDSNTYQQELDVLTRKALEQLKRKAMLMGANCIISLRLEHNEISGKNKQMFMVNAIGTAIKATPMIEGNKQDKTSLLIDKESVQVLLKTRQIKQAAESNVLSLRMQDLDFIIMHEVSEIAPQIVKYLKNLHSASPDSFSTERIEKTKVYFASIPEDIAKENLYSALENMPLLEKYALDLIGKLNLLDFERVEKMLESQNFEIRKSALRLMKLHKAVYEKADIEALEKLVTIIESSFKIRGQYLSEKSKFSSKVKEFWICECGEKMEMCVPNCYSCKENINGFTPDEITPEEAIILIRERQSVLKELLG